MVCCAFDACSSGHASKKKEEEECSWISKRAYDKQANCIVIFKRTLRIKIKIERKRLLT